MARKIRRVIMKNLDSLDARVMATNNAMDKATALAKIADLITPCIRSIDSAAKYIQATEKASAATAAATPAESEEINNLFGDIQ